MLPVTYTLVWCYCHLLVLKCICSSEVILHIIIITWLQCRSKTTYCDFYTVLTTGSITMKSGTVIISVPMSKSQQVPWQTLQECSVWWCVPASWCYFRVTLTDQIDISLGASPDGLCACAHVRQSVSILCTVTATFCSSCCWCQDCLLRCHKCNDTHISMFCLINNVNVGAHVMVTDFILFPAVCVTVQSCVSVSCLCWNCWISPGKSTPVQFVSLLSFSPPPLL